MTTIDEIQSYEKHCLDLITPATAHCIMKELGFPAVKEIPNSGNITSLLCCGVTHRSPFAQQWFTIFQGQDTTIGGVSIKKFANNMSNKLFGQSPLLFPLLHRYKLSITLSPSTFVISWQCSFFQFWMLKNLQTKKTHPRVKILNLHWSKPSMGIMMQVAKVLTHPMFPLSGGLFLSTWLPSHFGHHDQDLWITKFLLIMACVSQYHAGASSPLSCNKDVTIFQSNMRNAVANLARKTTRMVLQ